MLLQMDLYLCCNPRPASWALLLTSYRRSIKAISKETPTYLSLAQCVSRSLYTGLLLYLQWLYREKHETSNVDRRLFSFIIINDM